MKLDLGCGAKKQAGFLGVDCRPFHGVDIVADLTQTWPWENGSVDEVFCSHFVEHLKPHHRIHFVNELYRVLKGGGEAVIIVPHWANSGAYGDLTHEWPPVSEKWFYYLRQNWRRENAPHNDGYTCDFNVSWGYRMDEELKKEPPDGKTAMFMLRYYKEAAVEIIATLKKVSPGSYGERDVPVAVKL
jgi:SAM-dependent methyltransferase